MKGVGRTAAYAAAVLFFALSAVACGNGSDTPAATATPEASPTPSYTADVESTVTGINALMNAVGDVKLWASIWNFNLSIKEELGESTTADEVAKGKETLVEFCHDRTFSEAFLSPDGIWPPAYRRLDEAASDLCGAGFAITCCSAISLSLFAEDVEREISPIYESLELQTQYELKNLVIEQAEQRERVR